MDRKTNLIICLLFWSFVFAPAGTLADEAESANATGPASQISPTKAPREKAAPSGEDQDSDPTNFTDGGLPQTPADRIQWAQSRLQTLEGEGGPGEGSPNLASVREALTQVIALETKRQDFAAQAKVLDQQTETVAEDLQAIELPEFSPTLFLPIDKLRQRQAAANAALDAARQQVDRIDALASKQDLLQRTLPGKVTAARQRLAEAERELASPTSDANPTENQALRQSKLDLARTELQLYQQQQQSLLSRSDQLPKWSAEARQRLVEVERRLDQIEQAIAEYEQRRVRDRLDRHGQAIENAGADMDRSLVLTRRDQWLAAIDGAAETARGLEREQTVTADLAARRREVAQRIEADRSTDGGLLASTGLRFEYIRDRLPTVSSASRTINELDELIAAWTDLREEIDAWFESDTPTANEGFSLNLRGIPRLKDPALAQNERRLISSYRDDVDRYLSVLIAMRRELETGRETAEALRTEIDGALMWIRTSRTFGLADAVRSLEYLRSLFSPRNFVTVTTGLWSGLRRAPELGLALALWLVIQIFFAPTLRQRLETLAEAQKRSDRHWYRRAFWALLWTAVRAVRLPMTLWLLAIALEQGGEGVSVPAMALRYAAWGVLPLELIRHTATPFGLAVGHFGNDPDRMRRLARTVRYLVLIGGPLLLIWGLANASGESMADLSLGRLALFAGMVVVSWSIYRVMHPASGLLSGVVAKNPDGWIARLRVVWFAAMVGLPIVLAAISWIGYTHAAERLLLCLHGSLWLAWAMWLAWGWSEQMVRIGRRRLAARRLREAGQAIDPTGAGIATAADPTDIPVDEMSSQTMRLVSIGLLLIALYVLTKIWAPVVPAIQLLDAVPLYETVGADGAVRSITLAGLVMTIPIVVLTIVAVRNLPALLEVVFLQRLPIRQAARYAIVSLTTYVLVAIGVIASANRLGLRWENIQWLVAALGVGLGFGLQEIFANFISGLILLFEQPLRVGDIVTLDGTTGVVSRIRIRATTVTTWDRQELIIPNKDLITGKLVNWTLSDSYNRVIVDVGVAYGTDVTKACELFREICERHTNVTTDPAPVITMEGFGDSALLIKIRCFLTSLDVRLQTIHELHQQIYDRCGEEGIEIAFPQLDVHLKSSPPAETTIREAEPDGEESQIRV